MKDEKHMSLADIIKRDKIKNKNKPKQGGGIRGKMHAMKSNPLQGGRPRFSGKDFNG